MAAVERLRQGEGGDLTVMGSGDLLRTLMPHRLIDEYVLIAVYRPATAS